MEGHRLEWVIKGKWSDESSLEEICVHRKRRKFKEQRTKHKEVVLGYNTVYWKASTKNRILMVNVNGDSGVRGERWTIEKRRFGPCTVTIPPLRTCITGTSNWESLQVSLIEDNHLAGVFWERTVSNDVSWIVTEGTESVWTVSSQIAISSTKRTVVARAMVLEVAWGLLAAVGTLVLWTVDTKMPMVMAVKTQSPQSQRIVGPVRDLKVQLKWGMRRCTHGERWDGGWWAHQGEWPLLTMGRG